jgi:hypothetical protein
VQTVLSARISATPYGTGNLDVGNFNRETVDDRLRGDLSQRSGGKNEHEQESGLHTLIVR